MRDQSRDGRSQVGCVVDGIDAMSCWVLGLQATSGLSKSAEMKGPGARGGRTCADVRVGVGL